MQLDAFLEKITPVIHQTLRQALELGKWPDGRAMTEDEREASLQAVIVYEHQNLPQWERVGYMPDKCKSGGKAAQDDAPEDATILRFRN